MVVALKNSMRTLLIYLPCVTWAKKNVFFFFFTLSHSHSVSLYLFTRTAPLKMAEYLFVFCSLWNAHTLAECPFFLSFLLFSFSMSHTPKSLPKKWQADFESFASLLIKWKAEFEDSWNQAHKWALTRHGKQVGWTHTVRHPTISPSSPLWRRSSTQLFR